MSNPKCPSPGRRRSLGREATEACLYQLLILPAFPESVAYRRVAYRRVPNLQSAQKTSATSPSETATFPVPPEVIRGRLQDGREPDNARERRGVRESARAVGFDRDSQFDHGPMQTLCGSPLPIWDPE